MFEGFEIKYAGGGGEPEKFGVCEEVGRSSRKKAHRRVRDWSCEGADAEQRSGRWREEKMRPCVSVDGVERERGRASPQWIG